MPRSNIRRKQMAQTPMTGLSQHSKVWARPTRENGYAIRVSNMVLDPRVGSESYGTVELRIRVCGGCTSWEAACNYSISWQAITGYHSAGFMQYQIPRRNALSRGCYDTVSLKARDAGRPAWPEYVIRRETWRVHNGLAGKSIIWLHCIVYRFMASVGPRKCEFSSSGHV